MCSLASNPHHTPSPRPLYQYAYHLPALLTSHRTPFLSSPKPQQPRSPPQAPFLSSSFHTTISNDTTTTSKPYGSSRPHQRRHPRPLPPSSPEQWRPALGSCRCPCCDCCCCCCCFIITNRTTTASFPRGRVGKTHSSRDVRARCGRRRRRTRRRRRREAVAGGGGGDDGHD